MIRCVFLRSVCSACFASLCAAWLSPACSRLASQMKGVTVEGNGKHGVQANLKGVVALEGCTVRDNKLGDYQELMGGRIER